MNWRKLNHQKWVSDGLFGRPTEFTEIDGFVGLNRGELIGE